MMLSFQIRSMRKTVDGIVKRAKPPSSVLILKGHAEHLGVSTRPRNADAESSPMHDPNAKRQQPLCSVPLVELYMALKTAKGVDEPTWGKDDAERHRDQRQEDSAKDHS